MNFGRIRIPNEINQLLYASKYLIIDENLISVLVKRFFNSWESGQASCLSDLISAVLVDTGCSEMKVTQNLGQN